MRVTYHSWTYRISISWASVHIWLIWWPPPLIHKHWFNKWTEFSVSWKNVSAASSSLHTTWKCSSLHHPSSGLFFYSNIYPFFIFISPKYPDRLFLALMYTIKFQLGYNLSCSPWMIYIFYLILLTLIILFQKNPIYFLKDLWFR